MGTGLPQSLQTSLHPVLLSLSQETVRQNFSLFTSGTGSNVFSTFFHLHPTHPPLTKGRSEEGYMNWEAPNILPIMNCFPCLWRQRVPVSPLFIFLWRWSNWDCLYRRFFREWPLYWVKRFRLSQASSCGCWRPTTFVTRMQWKGTSGLFRSGTKKR